jgi:hypothetical protein
MFSRVEYSLLTRDLAPANTFLGRLRGANTAPQDVAPRRVSPCEGGRSASRCRPRRKAFLFFKSIRPPRPKGPPGGGTFPKVLLIEHRRVILLQREPTQPDQERLGRRPWAPQRLAQSHQGRPCTADHGRRGRGWVPQEEQAGEAYPYRHRWLQGVSVVAGCP